MVAVHWTLEVSDALLTAERCKRSTVADSSWFLVIVGALSIETDQETIARTGAASL